MGKPIWASPLRRYSKTELMAMAIEEAKRNPPPQPAPCTIMLPTGRVLGGSKARKAWDRLTRVP